MSDFSGLYVATLTPFDANDRLNLQVIRAHVEFLVDSGVAGLCPAGTTGEMLYMSVGEKARLVAETCAAARGRVKVVAGVWALRAKEAALLARGAEDAGADGVFLPPPIYYPADDNAIFEWYSAVRRATSLPLFAYNIPAYAGNAISHDCIERLIGEGIIVGIKDSSGKAEQMKSLVERFGSRIAVEAASDSFALEARKIGAHGFISALANIWPSTFVKLWSGEDSVQSAIDEARTSIKKAGGIPAVKYLTSRQGFAFGDSRLPGGALTADQKALLDTAFDAARKRGLK